MATKNDNALDFFHLLLDQRIWAYRACKAGVAPPHLVSHIHAHHRRFYPKFKTKRCSIAWVRNRSLVSLPCELLDLAGWSASRFGQIRVSLGTRRICWLSDIQKVRRSPLGILEYPCHQRHCHVNASHSGCGAACMRVV